MIPLEDYKKILSRPIGPNPFGTEGIEEPPELTDEDEEILDRCWAALAEERGVVQIPNQPSEAEIREHYERLKNL